MQVAVGPAERGLQDTVQLVEVHVGGELETTPQRRLGTGDVHADPIGDDVSTPIPAPRRRDRPVERVEACPRPGCRHQLLQHGLQVAWRHAGDLVLESPQQLGTVRRLLS